MRLTKLLATSALAIAAMGVASASAQDLPFTISGNVTATTDYMFRGISQTNNDPAIQAGLTGEHESGLFAGVWGSTVDFEGSDADAEVDVFVGYANEVGDLSYSAQALYYFYPGADGESLDYGELAVTGGYTIEWVTLKAGAYWSPDAMGFSGDAWYLTYGADIALSDNFTLFYNAGWNGVEQGSNWLDYNVGISATVGDVFLDVRYVDTDISGDDLADSRVVGSIGWAF